MFKRLVLEDWHYAIPYISFALTFGVFVVMVVRAIRMKQDKADHMAHLPLEDDSGQTKRKN